MSYGGYEYNQPTDPYGGGYGGGAGGGFLQGGGDYGGMQAQPGFGSPGGVAGGKMSRDQKTLLPVTVAQCRKARQNEPDDHYRIDNVELHQVKIVGQVVDVEETATMRVYQVDDGTGVMACRLFVDTEENDYQTERRMLCQKGAYVRVVGQLRDYQGQRHFSVHDMRPIKEGNEITHHLLEAIFVHCCNTKGRLNQKKAGMGGGGMGMGGNMGMGMGQMGGAMAGGFNAGGGGGMMMGGGGGGDQGLNNVHMAVLNCFQQDQTDVGVDVSTVVRQLAQSNISAQQVQEAVAFLANEGHIYTTTDEQHFKATG